MNTQALARWPWPAVHWSSSLLVTALLLLGGAAGLALAPAAQTEVAIRPFELSIPKAFGDWKMVNLQYMQVDPTVTRSGETSLNQPYDEILARNYQNSKGEVVMLSLAYGRQQRQEVKIHRPDLCYNAQGFQVVGLKSVAMPVPNPQGAPVQGHRMKAVREARVGGYTELVSYWMRIGSLYSEGAWDTRVHILTEGLSGRVPDGVLVRASRVTKVGQDEQATHSALEGFLAELVAAAPPDARRLLIR